MKFFQVSIFYLLIILITGCSSGGNSPVSENISDKGTRSQLDSIPVIAYDNSSALGMLGAYDLTISPDIADAELVPMRVSSIGESYVLSGASFFTSKNCLRVKSIGLDAGMRIHVVFEIRHPFEKGDPYQEPSWKNRHDLDLFDLALVILPENVPATSFDGLDADVYASVILNADGYTTELTEVIDDQAALPYKICYEDQNNNRFAMGTNWQEFDVLFAPLDSTQLAFDLYVTMGYGWSAKKDDRLHPVYYVPEFNRKPAWKVVVDPPEWEMGDTTSTLPLIIDVYDWNHGATIAGVYPDPDHPGHISSSSDIQAVYVDIPDFEIAPVEATTQDTNFDGFENPVSYKVNIANNNANLQEGSYLGLVKVVDSRQPANAVGEADTLVHVPDSVNMEFYTLPEFATYQVFSAKVIDTSEGYGWGWGGNFGSNGSDVGMDVTTDGDGNVYVTGYFSGVVDFDPGDLSAWFESNGDTDIFILKLNNRGDLIWARTIGGELGDEGKAIVIWNNSVFVTGYFQGIFVDFDFGLANHYLSSDGEGDVFLLKLDAVTGEFQDAVSWGGSYWDEGRSLAYSYSPNRIWVVGYFQGENVDFDPGPDLWYLSSYSSPTVIRKNSYLINFDYDLTFGWAGMWGAGQDQNWDQANDISIYNNCAYIVGGFSGNAEFDPSPGWGPDIHAMGGMDLYLTSYKIDTGWNWTRRIGSEGNDEGLSVQAAYNNPVVTGYFENTADFGNGDMHTSNGGRDVLLSQWDINGNYQWGHSWGAAGIWDEGHGVEVADSGKIFVTGCFENEVDFDSADLTDDIHESNGGRDIFLSQFDSNGAYSTVYTWGSMGIWDEGHGVDVGSVYVTGQFSYSMDFNPGPGEDWHASGGDTDIFLIQLKTEGRDETEPNDECDLADHIEYQNTDYLGAVRESVDDIDYWSFTGGTITYAITLTNESGYDIDLYVYNSDCSIELFSSTLPGSSDEIIEHDFDYGVVYKIKVINKNDGYSFQKNYIIRAHQNG